MASSTGRTGPPPAWSSACTRSARPGTGIHLFEKGNSAEVKQEWSAAWNEISLKAAFLLPMYGISRDVFEAGCSTSRPDVGFERWHDSIF